MNLERVGPGWSPTKARLNRRRGKQEKLVLDLSAHIDGKSSSDPLDTQNNNSASKFDDSISSLDPVALDAAIQSLNPQQQALLDVLQDKSKSVRERVQAEVTLARDPEAAQVMKNIKYSGGRKDTLEIKAKTEEEEARQLEALIQEEEIREKAEQAQFQKNRSERKREAREAKERERKAVRDAKQHAIDQRAKDAQALSQLAKTTKEKVQENAISKKQREKEEAERHEEFKRDMLSTETNDVLRTLKEARLDQQDIKTKTSSS